MGTRIIDCCSLLNLFAGWGGLEKLRTLPYQWSVVRAGRDESQFVREYQADCIVEVPLDLEPYCRSGLLSVLDTENDAELADYISFAGEVDDGEAQALAIAKHRGLVLLTDDRKATRIAARNDVHVRTITTAGVLREWVKVEGVDLKRLENVIERIEVLSRFAPRRDSLDWQWWVSRGRGK